MKKHAMLSALSITAAMVSPISSFPESALARSTQVEREFAQKFKVRSSVPARYTNTDGVQILGRVYLTMEQNPYSPRWPNLLKAEMTGSLYFESDEAVEKGYNDEMFTLWQSLAGEEGHVLLDKIHSEKEHNFSIYQVYGCSTTDENCSAEQFTLEFESKKIVMKAMLPESFEVLVDDYEWIDNKSVPVKKWKRSGQFTMDQIPLEDQ